MLNLTIFEITEADTLRKWGMHLMTDLHDKAVEEIRQEGLLLEAMHYFQISNRHFIVGVSLCNPDADIAEPDMCNDINRTHRKKITSTKIRKIPTDIFYELQA